MHWSLEKAEKLIRNNPNTEEFVCASGISPSGHIHIGNFRELVTTHFVVKALRKLGKKARFIFSWDDYDRFRKVPKNIASSYEQYLGLPYSDIPDPYGCCDSYARHFQNEFEGSIKEFGIEVEFKYQNQEYKSGRYNEQVAHAFNMRKEIYDILMDYKTQNHDEVERENYYPGVVYCHQCSKDNTTIHSYNSQTHLIKYSCICGFTETMNVMEANNMKLSWKIDWPMRWMFENVIFEPGGRDHSSVGGSYEVSSRISREIFNYDPPSYIPYEFIGIKGNQGKMSSSLGNLITPNELLNVYTPEIILYIFSKFSPTAAFNFGFDDEVIRNYTEYERLRGKYSRGELGQEDVMNTTMEFSDLLRDIDSYPSYSKIVGLLPILDFNQDILIDVLESNNEASSFVGIRELSSKIEFWIKNWNPDRAISIRAERNEELLSSISDDIKVWILKFHDVIIGSENMDTDELMNELYNITRTEDQKETKQKQKIFFKLLYQLLIDRDQGPRLSLLIKVIGADKVLALTSL